MKKMKKIRLKKADRQKAENKITFETKSQELGDEQFVMGVRFRSVDPCDLFGEDSTICNKGKLPVQS